MGKLRPRGGYRDTASFQTATIVYDGTYWFCERFLDPRSRTVDQMVQAARSGRQNIAEGSRFGATSSQTELRLVNAARSSQEELLLDFEDSSVTATCRSGIPTGPRPWPFAVCPTPSAKIRPICPIRPIRLIRQTSGGRGRRT